MNINKKLAEQMETCFKQTHLEMVQQCQGLSLNVAGGAACFSGFDSFFSQVVGWGFHSKPQQLFQELDAIEDFYRTLHHPRVDIELCPFTGTHLAELLSQRGYVMTELNNVSVLDLADYHNADLLDSIRIVKPEQFESWAERVAEGFGYPEAQEQFGQYLNINGATAFAVYLDEQIVAGATAVLHGTICDLGVTSTLAAYRCRGFQQGLLAARLNFAKQCGIHFAIVTTEPGSISDRNVQKAGFSCAYTRIKMTLDMV